MPKFSPDRSRQIKIKKMSLPKNALQISSEQVQDEHVSEEVPGPAVEEHRRDKLPGIGIANSAIADAKIIPNKTRLKGIEKKLGDKEGDIDANQRQ
jgi:hypothetical protein